MKLLKASLCAAVAVASMAVAGAACAQEEPAAAPASSFSFNVGAATSYTFRGIKNTYDTNNGNSGEVFGGVDWAGGPGLYAGVWASNTGRSNDNGIEIDYYAGWKPVVGPVSLDLGVIYYSYNDSSKGTVSDNFNTLEFKAAASVAAGPATLGAAIYYSDDFASTNTSSTYTEINFAVPVGKATISGAAGSFQTDSFGATDSYATYNLGVTFPIIEHVTVDVRVIDTDKDARTLFGKLAADQQFVGTLKATF